MIVYIAKINRNGNKFSTLLELQGYIRQTVILFVFVKFYIISVGLILRSKTYLNQQSIRWALFHPIRYIFPNDQVKYKSTK